MKTEFNRDTQYWDDFYRKNPELIQPSLFAQAVLPHMEAGKRMIEFGCGNGRDLLYFYHYGIRVLGVDASQVAISALQKKIKAPQLQFYCGDFTNLPETVGQADYCYSRFSLHAIDKEQEGQFLREATHALCSGGLLMIEARSIRDGFFGLGECVGRNSFFYHHHFRRFIVQEELNCTLQSLGFSILYTEESKAFAPFPGEDSCAVRVIAKKKGEQTRETH